MTSSGLVKAAATAPAIEPGKRSVTMSNIIHSDRCVLNFCQLWSVDNDNSLNKNFMILMKGGDVAKMLNVAEHVMIA